MMKKIFAIILCILMSFCVEGCNVSGKDKELPDTDNDTRYKEGFFTESKYINECLNMKFDGSNMFKFKNTEGISEKNRHISNIASIDFEALCFSQGVNVLFYNERIGKKNTMDDIISGINDRILENDSLWNSNDNNDSNDLVEIAGQKFRKLHYISDKVYKQEDTSLYIRLVGSNVFTIEITCIIGSRDIKKTNDDILLRFNKINEEDNINDLRYDSEKYLRKLSDTDKKIAEDPSVDMEFEGYEKGIIRDNTYTNRSVGIKFNLPQNVKITKVYNTSEFEASMLDGTCSVYIWNENLGCILSMEEYLSNVRFASNNCLPKVKEILLDNDKEEFVGKTWTVILRDMGKMRGDLTYMKQYTRLLKSNSYMVSFQYSSGHEDSFEIMKNAFSGLDED